LLNANGAPDFERLERSVADEVADCVRVNLELICSFSNCYEFHDFLSGLVTAQLGGHFVDEANLAKLGFVAVSDKGCV